MQLISLVEAFAFKPFLGTCTNFLPKNCCIEKEWKTPTADDFWQIFHLSQKITHEQSAGSWSCVTIKNTFS